MSLFAAAFVYVCMYVCMYVCIHTHTHTHMFRDSLIEFKSQSLIFLFFLS